MGNCRVAPVERIGTYELKLSKGVRIDLINCCFSPDMTRNIISFHPLFRQGFQFYFDKVIGDIFVFKDDFFIFKAYPFNGIYETVVVENLNNFNYRLNVDPSTDLDETWL